MNKKQIFYDTDCLSSFLDINDWSILEYLFDEIIIPNAVYKEFNALATPKHIKNNLNYLINENFVKVEDIDLFSEAYDIFTEISEEYKNNKGMPLGTGEAESIALAIFNNGILASNNFTDIKYFVDKYKIQLLTSAYMICQCVDKGFISIEKANSIWDMMIRRKISLPNFRFGDYYDGKYQYDLKDFGKRLKL